MVLIQFVVEAIGSRTRFRVSVLSNGSFQWTRILWHMVTLERKRTNSDA